MNRSLKSALLCVLVSCFCCCSGRSQTVPATIGSVPNIGFQLPRLGGSYSYALNAAEMVSTGFYGTGTSFMTDFDADLSYMSTSLSHPFSAVYDGGVLIFNPGSGQPTTTYQNLSVSQVLHTKNWNFEAQDGVSYMPESPAVGLSGIPGAGDLGVDPVPVGPAAGIGILTDYGPRVSNTATGSAARIITPHISAQANGYYLVQRFIGDNAQDGTNNDGIGGSAGVSYHLNTLSAITVSYNYSRFSFPGLADSYTAQGLTVDYSRQWTRRLSTDTYIGPQYISSSMSAGSLGAYPSSTQIAGGAELSYNTRNIFYTIGYSRGANNGSGVIPGSFSDNLVAGVHRQFGREWNVSGFFGYSRNRSLPVFETYNFDSNSLSLGGQVSRAFARRLSGYASYTIADQSSSGNAAALNAFSGFYQTFAIGLSYSPGLVRLGK